MSAIYNFVVNVYGDSQDELERSARDQAGEFFGIGELILKRGSVSPSEKEGYRYQGTYMYELTERHPGLS